MNLRKIILIVMFCVFGFSLLCLTACTTGNGKPHEHTLKRIEREEATCEDAGNIEYWFCQGCGEGFSDTTCTKIVTYSDIAIPAKHNLTYKEAKEATCTANGNIEHWYCNKCNTRFSDETAQTRIRDGVNILAQHSLEHIESVAPTEITNGLIEHWHCAACDKYYDSATAVNEISQEQTVVSKLLCFTLLDDDSYQVNSPNSGVSSIVIPATYNNKTVTSIAANGFADNTSLTEITLPNTLTTIGNLALSCGKLTTINVADDNAYFKSVDGNLYSKDGKALIQYAIGKTATAFTVPDTVTAIGKYAFADCTLGSITFANSTNWWYADSSTATSGESINFNDVSTNATYLANTYKSYYFKRTV